jgi:hypothetical protein
MKAVPIDWDEYAVSGFDADSKEQQKMMLAAVDSLKRNKVGLKGGNLDLNSYSHMILFKHNIPLIYTI